jgi:hypothetical protein
LIVHKSRCGLSHSRPDFSSLRQANNTEEAVSLVSPNHRN